MKKWRVALFLCVALCLAACAALADDHLNVYVSNAELQGGAVSGAYYYVVRVDTNLEEFQLGRNDDVSASEPDGWYSPRPDTWYQDEDGSFMIYMPPKRGEGFAESEAIFYRMNDDDAWTRIVLNYDLSKQGNVNIAIGNADQPTLLQPYNCVLNWNAVSGVDAYRFTWNMPNGDMGTITTETSVDLSFFYPEFLLGEVGHYECWVDAFKDNQYLHTSAEHTYFDIGPVLSFADYNEDFVIVNDEGNSATMKQNQWMWFTCQTPGAQYVTAHELGEGELPNDGNQFDYGNPDDGGYVDFKWMVVGGNETVEKEIVVLAHLEDGSTVESNHLWVTSVFDSEITGEVTFSVPDDVNNVVDGVCQVARDGRLFVDVDNIDADFYNLYIVADNVDDGWIADSHWVSASDGATTRVPLTVPRCEPREEPYQVHVFAVKFGAEQKDAVATIPIHVTEASDPDSPIIVSMGSEYTVREPLRVFAHYTNPDDIEGHMEIRIVNKDDPNDIPYWGEGGFEDYWDEGGICMHDGDYVVEVMIWNSEGYPQIEFTPAHEFHVYSDGDVAPSEVNTLTVLPQGEDLVLNMSALATDEYAEAEGFYLALQRIDWGWQYLDEMELPAENGEATFTFSGDNDYFEPNGIYKVIVSGYRYGYNSSYTEFRFVVSEASTDNAITLTINGNDDPVQDFLSQENMDVRISWTGEKPTAVRILNGEHWEIWWDDDDYHRDWHFGDGALLMVAEASWTDVDWEHVDWDQFNWNNLDWSAQSNSIRMNVSSPFGPMRAPEVTLDNAELNPIPWGEDLIVNIVDEGPKDEDGNLVDGGWFYGGIEVERKDEDNAWDYVDFDYRFHSGVNNLTTYCLEPDSNCRVFVGADAVGYNGRDQYHYFSVGERPEETEAVKYFKVNGQTGSLDAMVDDSLPLCAYHSNAEWYNVEITKEGDEGWRDGRSRDRSGMLNDDWGVPESGIYTLNAYAYGRTDEGEEWEDWIGSVQVNATALGRIAEIEINTFAILPFGEDLALEYSAVPKESDGDDVSAPDWFHLSIERIDWSFENLFEADFDTENGTGSFTISADDMHGYELHGIYKVAISAHKIGFDCYYREFCFVIGDAELPQDLVLTVDGSTDEYQEKLSSQNMYVQVSWTGNEKPTAVRFLNGDNWEYWWGGDNFDRDWGFGDRDFVMYAEATWDDVNWDDVDWENFDWNALNWSAKSNTIRIVITSPRGDMKVPDFSLDNPEFSEGGSQTIPWGEDLILTIHDEAPMDTDGNPVDEGWFNCDIEIERCDENGNRWWEYSNFEYYIYSGVNYLTTYCLDPGSHCRMHIGADGVGYNGRGTSYDFYVGEKPEETGETIKYFKVKGQTEPVNAMVNESLMLSAYHSDAQWYNVEITKEDNEDWHDNRSRDQRGMLNDNWGVPGSGVYTLTAYAYGRTENGEWEEEIGSITISATAEGRVADIDVDAIHTLTVGDDLVLHLSAVPGESDGDDVVAADNFYVNLTRVNDGWQFIDEQSVGTENGTATITFGADRFEAGNQYIIKISALKHRCDEAYTEFRFIAVSEDAEQNLVLLVDDSTDDQTKLSSYNMNVRVEGFDTRPTAIRVMNGDNWEYWWGDDSFERDWSFGDDTVIYAEASWSDVDLYEIDRNGWQDFDWNTDLEWTAHSNVVYITIINPNPQLVAPNFGLENPELGEGGSGVIPWGDDLILNVYDEAPMDEDGNPHYDCWFYGFLHVERYNDYGGYWENANFNPQISSGLNYISTYALEGGCRYSISVGTDGAGYNGRSRSIEFRVGDRTEEQPIEYFTANGESEELKIETHTEFTMYAYYTGAEWYNVVITQEGNDDWHEDKGDTRNGVLCDRWSSQIEGTFYLTAYAYGRLEEADENGNWEWEHEIGTITLRVYAPHEDLREPEVEMGDLAYMGGDPIVINFYGPDEAEYFNYWVHSSEDGNWRAGSGRDGIGEAILRTNRLDSGVYWVEFDAQAAGYNQGHATLHFALLDPNDVILNAADGSYYFSVSATEVQTEETVHIVAYMPGTDAIRIFSSRNGDDLEEFDYRDGPGMSTYFNRGDPADFGIYISGHEINGDWTEPVQVTTVTYTAIDDLEEPHLTINGSDVGYTVIANSRYPNRLTIMIDPVKHAESYYVEIREYGDGQPFYSEFFEETENGVNEVIEDDRIQPGKMYHIYCDSHAVGYVCTGYSRTFMLKSPNVSTDVTLDITPRDSEEFWTAESAHVTAESTGATAIKICMNNEVRYYCGDYVEDDWMIWDDENIFYAFSTTDKIPNGDFDWNEVNVNWNKQSSVIPIYADSYGDTLVPTLSFDSPVQKGEWFEFTIEDDGDARQMDIRISDDWGNEIEFRRLWKPGTYRLPIAKMFVGQHYTVWLTCVQSRHKWTEGPRMDLYFEDAQQGQNDTYFRVDKDELYPGEPFIPTVYAKDAIHLWVADTDDEAEIDSHLWGDWDGEWGTNGADWEWWYNDPGTYQLYAFAQYEENGNRQLIGTVEITVLEPITLDAPQINVGPVENVNEDTVITIPLVPNAYHYNLMVHQTDMENKRVFRDYKNVNDAENGVITFTIAANELEANASYWCDVYIDPEDGSYAYRGSENHINFMTTRGATINNLEIRLDEAYLDGPSYRIPINTGFNAEITVRPNGSGNRPTAIALCMGDHVWYSFVNGDVENMGLSEYQACPETLYAKACYDDLSDYTSYDDVPWDQLNWSNPTGPVLVTFYAEGYAEPAEIIYSRVIMSGREIYINVTLGEHANEAHANLNRSLESYYEDMVFPYWIGMEDGVIRIPTEGLDCGEYQLYVDSSGEAYQNNRTYGYVRIVENPYESDSRMMLPAGLTEIEAEAFEGIAARAVIIPYGVTSIGSRAFADSNVRLVIIPSSVTSIADDAFDGSNLTIIYGGSMYVEHYANQLEVCFCHIGN